MNRTVDFKSVLAPYLTAFVREHWTKGYRSSPAHYTVYANFQNVHSSLFAQVSNMRQEGATGLSEEKVKELIDR